MEKRRLGRTNFEVSAVGVGGIPLQRVNKEEALAILREALNQGINFIDTARGYMASEELLGYALEEIGREKFILATKSMNRSYDGIIQEFNLSLKLLKTDYIDLYQFHNVRTKEDLDKVMAENGPLTAIKELKKAGKVKEIGITSHSKDILDIAIDTGEFSTIQFPYNAIERQGEPIFEKARKKNIGVIIMKPLAGGAITEGEVAVRFVLQNENVSVVIPGMDTVDQVVENSRAGIDRRPLRDEEKEILQKAADELGSEFCRRCGYCAPCTVGIDIPVNFTVDSYFTRYNLQEWARERFNSMTINAKHCIECGECEIRCPYNLPIMDMLKKVASHY